MIFRRARRHPNEIGLDQFHDLTDDFHELARLWISQSRTYVMASPELIDSPSVIGRLIAESVEVLAQGYEERGIMPREQAAVELWQGVELERASFEQNPKEKEQD